ncbi:hypothetical protein RI129_000177 [Pyrocoelia pectoralis]|uniref:Separase n=1 Tax=Pyrocoelia pectoralis TaxID=417401 RepID=A0AAN7V393_9COLE
MVFMDNNTKKVIQSASQGNFGFVYNSVLANSSLQKSNIATNIIIECCRVFTGKNTSLKIVDDDLLKLLNTCVRYIDKLSVDHCLSYLRAIFYIFKYCFEKDKLDIVLQLKEIVINTFITLENDELKKIYNSIWSLFHNAVLKMSKSSQFDKNDPVYFQLCLYTLKVYSRLHPNHLTITNMGCNYFRVARCYSCNVMLQCKYYLALFHFLKEVEVKIEVQHLFVACLKILGIVIKNLFRQNELGNIQSFIEQFRLFIEVVVEKKNLELLNVLSSSSELIVEFSSTSNSGKLIQNLKECVRSLKCHYEKYKKSIELQYTCNLVYGIFKMLFDYFTEVIPSVWKLNMDESAHLALYNLLGTISHITSENKFACQMCNERCDVDTNIDFATNVMVLIGSFTKFSIQHEVIITNVMSNQTLWFLERSCKNINVLKNKNCSNWKSLWAEVGILIYNIAVKLYFLKHTEAQKYFILLLRNLITLEGTFSSEIFKIDALEVSLKCLIEINTGCLNFNRALLFCSIHLLLRPDSHHLAFKQWVIIKSQEKQSEISTCTFQEMTIRRILKENRNEILSICEHLEQYLQPRVIIKLLLLELTSYKNIWPSRVPMLSVFKEIYENCDLLTTVKVLINVWGNSMSSAHTDLFELLSTIIQRFEEDIEKFPNDVHHQMYFAQLCVMKYYSLITEVRQKNLNDMSNLTTLNNEKQSGNSNDSSDLVPSYTHLKINEQMEIMKYLIRALDVYDMHIPTSPSVSLIGFLKDYDVFNVIENIGFEFRLYCNLLQSARAWFLCLRISKLLHHNLYTLKSIGFLIENSFYNSTISELLAEADLIIKNLSNIKTAECYNILVTFYINKSIMLLNNQQIKDGYLNYEIALKWFQEIKEKEDHILNARLEFLNIQYLLMPCSFTLKNHADNALGNLSQPYIVILNYFQLFLVSGYASSYGLSLLFEVNCMIIYNYKWMYLPRELRCYSRDLVVLAQKLVIPLRTATILCYLAHADLQSSRINDCQVKLAGLLNILCLDDCKYSISKVQVTGNNGETTDETEVTELTDRFSEILLDCPKINEDFALTGSPLLTKTFSSTTILSHSDECQCYYCLSIEYQKLSLDVMHLEALSNLSSNDERTTKSCFKKVMQFHQRLCINNSVYIEKLCNTIPANIFFDAKDILEESHSALLLDYAKYLVRKSNLLKAKEVIENLMNVISTKMYFNPYLFNEIHLEFVTLLLQNIEYKENVKVKSNKDTLTVDFNDQCVKTPENNQSKVVFYKSYSPNPESPPKRVWKRIKCDFTEDEQPIKNTSSETLLPILTPVCSREALMVTNLTTANKVEVSKGISVHVTDTNVNLNDNSVIQLSPNAYTPNAIKASAGLKTRTKLLTNKLKLAAAQRSKQNVFENEFVKDDIKQDEGKSNVCKNLMSELCAVEKKPTYKKKQSKEGRNDRPSRVTRANSKAKM